MIVIDTSAWVEFLRDTGSPVCVAVDELIDGDIAICDPISMEVLAGARSERHLTQLRGLLARATMLPTTSADFDEAAALYRTCRTQGTTVRRLVDCLIGAVAIAADAELLHATTTSTDWQPIARFVCTPLHQGDTNDQLASAESSGADFVAVCDHATRDDRARPNGRQHGAPAPP